MKHLLLQDRYLTYIQISRPVGPQHSSKATMVTKKMLTPPESTFFNQEEDENMSTDKPFNFSIFDLQTSDSDDNGNWRFNSSNFNTSKDDDSVGIDIELEKQLNKHFGISSSTGTVKKATSSFRGVVSSASSLGATNTTNTAVSSFKAVTSTSVASTTTTTMTTDSKTCSCSKKTTEYGEKYEVIPLDTHIIFDCEGYGVPIFMPVEDKPRWRVYPEGVYFHVWADTKPCYIAQTIDDETANKFSIEQVSASCTYEPGFIQECHRAPISVDRYIDYLYSIADAHSAKVTGLNLMMFFFTLKEVCNLVDKKQHKQTFVSIPRCVYPHF